MLRSSREIPPYLLICSACGWEHPSGSENGGDTRTVSWRLAVKPVTPRVTHGRIGSLRILHIDSGS